MESTTANGYFPRFAWAVPLAFSGPLGACRFEQGDILYDTPEAYTLDWAARKGIPAWSIQVVLPVRGPLKKSGRDGDSIFAENWSQPALIRLTDHAEGATAEVQTTHGRIYSTLWHGDRHLLTLMPPEPVAPMVARELLPKLAATVEHFRKLIKGSGQGNVGFIIPEDLTNDILLLKHSRVFDGLARVGHVKVIHALPEDANLVSRARFAPTLGIACYVVESRSQAAVESVLKSVLYVPSPDKRTSRESFKMSAHGLVFQL